MKKLLNLFIITLLLNFSLVKPERRYYASSKIFWKHMKQFELEYKEFNVNLQNIRIMLDFGLLIYEARGYCYTDKVVGINPVKYKYLSESGKEALIFHELGHCVLGLEHTMNQLGTNDWQEDKYCPTSLMHAGHRPFHDRCYRDNRQYYIDSLKILRRSDILHGK